MTPATGWREAARNGMFQVCEKSVIQSKLLGFIRLESHEARPAINERLGWTENQEQAREPHPNISSNNQGTTTGKHSSSKFRPELTITRKQH